jgi:hypothetical protein
MNANYGDDARNNLRTLVAKVGLELEAAPAGPKVAASWAELVAALALGDAPETRACPTCGDTCMRGASRCSKCWHSLEPLASERTVPERAV